MVQRPPETSGKARGRQSVVHAGSSAQRAGYLSSVPLRCRRGVRLSPPSWRLRRSPLLASHLPVLQKRSSRSPRQRPPAHLPDYARNRPSPLVVEPEPSWNDPSVEPIESPLHEQREQRGRNGA